VEDGEQCDGSDCCSSTCEFLPSGSACSDDNDSCTKDTCDQNGQCQHQTDRTLSGCGGSSTTATTAIASAAGAAGAAGLVGAAFGIYKLFKRTAVDSFDPEDLDMSEWGMVQSSAIYQPTAQQQDNPLFDQSNAGH